MASFNVNSALVGLGTSTFGIPVAAFYNISGKLTLPTITDGDASNSQVVVTINQNGSPIYTGQAGARGFGVEASCQAGDTIAIILSSSATVDNLPNTVHCVLSIG